MQANTINKTIINFKKEAIIMYPTYIHNIIQPVNVYSFNDNTNIDMNLENCILFLNNSSGSWQHFIQDSLHLIIFCIPFLNNNPNISLVLENPRNDFKSLEFILKNILNIQNNIIYLEHSKKINIKITNFFECLNEPNILYAVTPQQRRNVHTLLMKYMKENCNSDKKYLTYFTRKNCKIRKVLNEKEIIIFLKKIAKALNLNFIIVDTNEIEFKKIFDIMYNSKIVIAPHGGSNYNLYFCKCETLFIEFVLVNNTHSISSVVQSIGLDYFVIPCDNNNNFIIDIKELDYIFKQKYNLNDR